MKLLALTSSRADYSILFPLLSKLKSDKFFNLDIAAFGTHLSKKHGETVDLIIKDGFEIKYTFETNPTSDTPQAISQAMSNTILLFTKIWEKETYDLILVIGDRYEMFAACVSSIPFNIKIGHIHGGETTLGAFDDCLRNSITQMASIHFTAAQEYKMRAIQIKGNDECVFNVGALSIDNLKELNLLSVKEFKRIFKIDLALPSILITFHPETKEYYKNEDYVSILIDTLRELVDFQLIITMPNTDTMGLRIREAFHRFKAASKNVITVENFGTIGYLSCMKFCKIMLGNTSSGFIEASFFPKYVINIGKRQKGRIVTSNIINVPIEKTQILDAIKGNKKFKPDNYSGIYGNGEAADKIISILKKDGLKKI